MASSTASSSLSPPAAKILMPLSGMALCDAEMTTPRSAPKSAVRNATAGVGSTPSSTHVDAGRGEPGGDRGLQHLAAGPRVAAERRPAAGRGLAAAAGRGADSARGTPGWRRADAAPGTPNPGARRAPGRPQWPGAARAPGSGRRWPDRGHRRCRTAGPRRRQRFEYCGALRAFFRPYFLRSLARASRVRKPAFFSGGRSVSSSSMSARAMASRSAPAWPVTPPPCRRGDDVVDLGLLQDDQRLLDRAAGAPCSGSSCPACGRSA